MTRLLLLNSNFSVSTLQTFSGKYQTSLAILPYLYDDLMELLRNVLQLYVKYEVIEKCKTVSDYE